MRQRGIEIIELRHKLQPPYAKANRRRPNHIDPKRNKEN